MMLGKLKSKLSSQEFTTPSSRLASIGFYLIIQGVNTSYFI